MKASLAHNGERLELLGSDYVSLAMHVAYHHLEESTIISVSINSHPDASNIRMMIVYGSEQEGGLFTLSFIVGRPPAKLDILREKKVSKA